MSAQQCWRLESATGDLPGDSRVQVGVIAKFLNGRPTEAIWNDETKDWVALRWAKCEDPRVVAS